MRLSLLGLAIATVATVSAARPAIISQPTEFGKAIAAVRADADNYDKFKEPLRTPLEGQSFKMILPFEQFVTGSGAQFDYDDGKLVLGLKMSKTSSLRRGLNEHLPVLKVTESTKNLGSYVGQNAFGATAQVKSFKAEGAGLALISAPRATHRGGSYVGNQHVGGDEGWWFEEQLPPAEAKATGLKSSVIIEGNYTKLPWGDPGFCDFGGVQATLDHPTDFYSQACYLGANVTRIAFVSDDTGAVLKEWTSATSPQIGAELWRGIRIGMSKEQVKANWPGLTDYGYLDLGSLTATIGFGDQGVEHVEVHLPISTALDGTAYSTLVQKYGQPVAGQCADKITCSVKWTANPDVSVYLTTGATVTFQGADIPPPYGFHAQ